VLGLCRNQPVHGEPRAHRRRRDWRALCGFLGPRELHRSWVRLLVRSEGAMCVRDGRSARARARR
jgi:hypothetical protein